MNKRTVATPKQTSGAGFVFEDKVVAYYLSWMLVGGVPFASLESAIARVDCQTRVDGWLLDDLLLTCINTGEVYRYAFSIKSNLQFTHDSAPKDFVQDVWSQYLKEESGIFLPAFDRLGLICIPQPDPPRTAIQNLLRKAHNQISSQLLTRIDEKGYASPDERNLFRSFACPEDLAIKHDISSNEHIGGLLNRVIILDHDFEDLESKDEATGIFLCQQLLEDASINLGKNLWQALCKIAQRLRTSGGGISQEELRLEIKSQFAIRDFPDFSNDWHRLKKWFESELQLIPDKIGGSVRIERPDEVENVSVGIKESNFTVLLGASGTGKSVIAKKVAENFADSGNVIWFRGGQLQERYFETFANHHGLRHPLRDVFANARFAKGLVVVDGIEKLLQDEQFRELALLFHILEIGKNNCSWQVLIVGRTEEWERIQADISRYYGNTIEWNTVLLPAFKFDQLQPVWEKYPSLKTLAIRPHLREFLKNAKVLDILATVIQSGHELLNRSWVGESDIIKWYWKTVVGGSQQRAVRSALLVQMAEIEANSNRFEISESDLSYDQLGIIPSLGDMLQVDQDHSTISFSHDLFADWARFYALLLHEDSLNLYLRDKTANPHWQKAIRLYGIKLLEEDGTADAWERKLNELPEIRNILLESLIFAGNSQQLLSNAHQILIAENGRLLKDLIKRFLHVATIPNQTYIKIAQEIGSTETEARTWERLPLWMYWLGMLPFLALHSKEIVGFVHVELAQVAHTWLRYTPFNWPGRDYAVDLALVAAWQTFRTRPYYHGSDKELTITYKAALEGFHDKPDDVRQLALKACSRILPVEQDGKAFDNYEIPGTVTDSASVIYGGKRVTQQPWADGPLYRVDEVFRATCINSDTLRQIMEDEPYLAKEILLALLIEARAPRGLYWNEDEISLIPGKGVHLVDDSLFHPRFYTRGPFLIFLNINPQIALETFISLIDFATDRRIESQLKNEQSPSMGIELSLGLGKKLFSGDANVFHWYHAIAGSDLIGSVLMAVEKWFYSLLDKKEPVEEWLSLILEKGKSLAWIGVLSEVGRYSPHLFAKTLQPLLLVPHFYYFEQMYELQGGLEFGTPFTFLEGEWFWKLSREWDKMEHRRYKLLRIATQLFFSDENTKNAILNNRGNWREDKVNNGSVWDNFVVMLIETFNQDNWKEVQLADGSTVLAFDTPDHLKPSVEQEERSRKHSLLISRPFECRKRLDENNPLDHEVIQDFLDQAKTLIDAKFDDPEKEDLFSPANSIIGTIAVIVNLHRDWLSQNSDEEKWCIAKLVDILEHPPKWPGFDIPESIGDDTWEHFICESVPVFWSENPEEPNWRRFVANLVLVKHYSALQILLKKSFDRRDRLGDSFWELVGLILDWSFFKYEILTKKSFHKISSWHNKATNKFVNRKYSFSILKWGKTTMEKGDLRISHAASRFSGKNDVHIYTQIAHVDFSQIRFAFSDIFMPKQALNNIEREQFFLFWDQALMFSLIRTKCYDENGGQLDANNFEPDLPSDYDYWILQKAANVISQMRQDENADRYWEPILALGPRAEYWIERFLYHWIMDKPKNGNLDNFIYHWQSMLNYCFTSDSWVKKTRFSYHIPKLWLSLLGFASFGGSLWEENDNEIISKMQEYFVRAISHIFKDSSSAAKMISWLGEKPSSSSIRVVMLKPIFMTITNQSEDWLKEERLLSALASYLNVLWDAHRQEIRPFQSEFDGLLSKAVSYHEPLALELQSRISSRN